jgi:structural maintenance of chromosome 2
MLCSWHFAIGAGPRSDFLDFDCPYTLKLSFSKQVRAGSLQELVYKQGQAGVTRATVTVVFSNKDKNQSPVGYEAYDEIAVCRQVLNLHSC